MKMPAKTGLLTASLVLAGASLVGCGGGDGGDGGAPTDASKDDFCKQLTSLFSDLGTMADATDKEAVAAIKNWARDLEKVGTPETMSDEARDGFELMLDQVADLDEDDTTEDFQKLDDDLSDSEKEAVSAFEKYTTDTCGGMDLPDQELPEIPSS
jgi:hypothetical protein